jgi:hypothetical protein
VGQLIGHERRNIRLVFNDENARGGVLAQRQEI